MQQFARSYCAIYLLVGTLIDGYNWIVFHDVFVCLCFAHAIYIGIQKIRSKDDCLLCLVVCNKCVSRGVTRQPDSQGVPRHDHAKHEIHAQHSSLQTF